MAQKHVIIDDKAFQAIRNIMAGNENYSAISLWGAANVFPEIKTRFLDSLRESGIELVDGEDDTIDCFVSAYNARATKHR